MCISHASTFLLSFLGVQAWRFVCFFIWVWKSGAKIEAFEGEGKIKERYIKEEREKWREGGGGFGTRGNKGEDHVTRVRWGPRKQRGQILRGLGVLELPNTILMSCFSCTHLSDPHIAHTSLTYTNTQQHTKLTL